MNILQEKKNPLLHREELIITIESEVIPTNSDVKKQISEKTKKPEENIIIENINSDFGNKTFKINALVYDDVESKEKYTTVSRKELKKRAEEAKKAVEEKEKEAKKAEEKPAEETEAKESTKEESANTKNEDVSNTIEDKKEEDKPADEQLAKPGKEPTDVNKEEGQPDKEPTETKLEEKEE